MKTGILEMDENHMRNDEITKDMSKEEKLLFKLYSLPKKNLDKCEKIRLELELGPMFSGKTTELRRKLARKATYKRVFAVNTKKDTRYGESGLITHDGITFDSVRVDSLYELRAMNDYIQADVIGIDEGQFFPEIFDFVIEELHNTSKSFIISGLDGDKNKKFFGNLHLLIPHADRKHFLTALCKRCGDGTEAPFTASLKHFSETEKIGGMETYEPVCRAHYDEIVRNYILKLSQGT